MNAVTLPVTGPLAVYAVVVQAMLAAAVLAFLATPVAMWLAHRVGAVDDPSGDARRVHAVPTPRMGGIAIAVAVLATTVVMVDFSARSELVHRNLQQVAAILACSIVVCAIGALDDAIGLDWRTKLGGQVAIALTVVFAPLAGSADTIGELVLPVSRIDPPLLPEVVLPAWLAVTLAVAWIVALMNMMNFIDGVDGLATGMAVITATTFAIIAVSYSRINIGILAAATAGGAAGFLPWNFRRGGARVFMGDAGSMLLGFLLAVIALQGVLKTAAAVSLVIPLALLAVPIFDTAFVVAKRMKHGVSPAQADRWHLHHRLLNVGYTPRRVAVAFWLWTASLSALALALRFVNYGNSLAWRVEGLATLAGFVLLAVFFTAFLLVTLEIFKTPAVRARNRATRERYVAARASEPGDAAPGAAVVDAAAPDAAGREPASTPTHPPTEAPHETR